MSEENFKMLLDNEKEWRSHILERLDRIEKKQDLISETATTLKVKVGLISTIFGAIGAGVIKWASVFLGRG